MNTLSLLYLRFRHWYVPASLLLMLLQRTPIVRAIISTESSARGPVSAILRSAIAGSTALGAIHTVAGATTINPAPGSDKNPAPGKVGESFTGGFAIIGAPSSTGSYEVKGTIPAGLAVTGISGDTVNASVVTITGTPTESGTFPLDIRAWHSPNKSGDGGERTYRYTIEIAASQVVVAPTISSHPASASLTPGASLNLAVTASGDPAPSYQWKFNGANISGATGAQLSLTNLTIANSGNYTVTMVNAGGSVTSNVAVITVQAPIGDLAIQQQPVSTAAAIGSIATLSFGYTAPGSVSIQWYRYTGGNTTPIPVSGATASILQINNLQPTDMGFYYAEIKDGTQTLQTDIIPLAATGAASRLLNLSTRGRLLAGGSLTPGFVMSGNGQKRLLMRSVGPQLLSYGVADALADPVMDVFPLNGSSAEKHNDNWGDNASRDEIRTIMSSVGAFALDEGSRDAVLLENLALPNSMGNRGYTVRIGSTAPGSSGIAIAEIYDPESMSANAALINVSARGYSGEGADALVPGFVIGGSGAKRMLIRVVGPTLASYGVPNTMPNPKLSIIPLGQDFSIAANDDWNGAPGLVDAFNSAGAFAFSENTSGDAAVVVTLPPGGYTVRVESSDGSYGNVLVEAYDLDPQ
ncbi:MAG: hypothetical protein SynsKO_40740 [Synoicihabitans sp.]